ncbi:MAG: GatB/YqeY domain-containing protein [Thermodesulfobacteriota bacterium]
MSLFQTLEQDFKAALKAKDEVRVMVLRMLRTAMKNKEVELRRKLEEPEVLGLISTQIKQRRDSIEQFHLGGREDLVRREEAELAVLEAYLPRQLSRAEVEAAAAALISELGASSAKDLGRIMKAFMSKYAGQADGKVVSEVVKGKLAAL